MAGNRDNSPADWSGLMPKDSPCGSDNNLRLRRLCLHWIQILAGREQVKRQIEVPVAVFPNVLLYQWHLRDTTDGRVGGDVLTCPRRWGYCQGVGSIWRYSIYPGEVSPGGIDHTGTAGNERWGNWAGSRWDSIAPVCVCVCVCGWCWDFIDIGILLMPEHSLHWVAWDGSILMENHWHWCNTSTWPIHSGSQNCMYIVPLFRQSQ